MIVSTRQGPTVGPIAHSPEWYAAHRTHLTATDAAAICGHGRHRTARHVIEEKLGRLPRFEGNEFTRRGLRYEPAIAADYADTAGVEIIYPLPMYFHPTIAYLAASPDVQIAGTRKGAELKFSMSRDVAAELGDEGTDWVPSEWAFQTQQQMDVMDWEEVDVAVLLFGRLRIFNVPRNDDLIGLIHEAAEEMHQRIIDDRPPEFAWTHPRNLDLIKALYGVQEGTTCVLGHEAQRHWVACRALGETAKQIEKERDEHKAHVLAEMGEHAIGLLGDGMEVVRSVVQRKEYTVKATQYVTVRERKCK